jgi:AcrR family transcriptional regulator
VSKGTLYRFFENKEDLFLEMMIDSYQKARQAVAPDDPDRSAAENLRSRLEGLAKVLDVTAPRSRVHYQAFGVVGDSPEASARLYEFLSAFHRERYLEYAELVRAGQVEGAFRSDVDPGLVAHLISGLISGFIYRASFDSENATPESLQGCFETVFRDVLQFEPDARPAPEEADA